MNEHESAFIQAFIVREKRQRYLDMLPGPKRKKILARLNHVLDVDWRFATVVPRNLTFAGPLLEALRSKGAGRDCYMMTLGDLDGAVVPLEAALEEITDDYDGAVLSCLPGRLALYKDESPGDYFILERPAGVP